MHAPLGRIIIYTRKIEEMSRFYCRYFGFREVRSEGDRLVELIPVDGGATLLLHLAGKGQKQGQSLVKLVFDVEDVTAFCRDSAHLGLTFGPIHQADGYEFANAKDPSNNTVSVSSRAFAAGASRPTPG